MTSFHELERSGRAERSYPTYVRDRPPAWIAGLVALAAISGQMKNACSEFTVSANQIGHAYRGAAEDARKAVASLKY